MELGRVLDRNPVDSGLSWKRLILPCSDNYLRKHIDYGDSCKRQSADAGSLLYGVAYPTFTHIAFGMVGGLFGAGLVHYSRKRGERDS